MKADLFPRASRGKYWYIKGFNGKKSFNEIKTHIETNDKNNYRNNSTLWLINYI